MFGSSARSEGTARSDIDVLLLVPNSEEGQFRKLMNSIDNLAGEVSGRYPTKLAPIVMMREGFEKSIKDRKRFAVDVLKDGIVLFGLERCYHLLSRVI